MTARHIVVIGGGPAGVFAAIEAKRRDAGAEVTLISDEPSEPYERPPLSKAVLLGKARAGDAPIAGPKGMAGHGVTLMLHTRCAAIDRTARAVVTAAGRRLPYDALVIATGSTVRQIPALPLGAPRVHYLRTEAHADALARGTQGGAAPRGGRRRPDRPRGRGLRSRARRRGHGHRGGAAHSRAGVRRGDLGRHRGGASPARRRHPPQCRAHRCRDRGATAASCSRSAAETSSTPISSWSAPARRRTIASPPRRASRPTTASSSTRSAAAPIPRSSRPGMSCAFPAPHGLVRQEDWRHAQDQGSVAGRNAAGASDAYRSTPSFWSEQFGLYIQGVGWPSAQPDRRVRRRGANLLTFELSGPHIGYAIGINAQRDMAVVRRLIERRVAVDPAALADPTIAACRSAKSQAMIFSKVCANPRGQRPCMTFPEATGTSPRPASAPDSASSGVRRRLTTCSWNPKASRCSATSA